MYGNHVEPQSDGTAAHPTGPMHSGYRGPCTDHRNYLRQLCPSLEMTHSMVHFLGINSTFLKKHMKEISERFMSHYHTSALQGWIQKHCCHPRGQGWAGSQRPIMKQVQGSHGNSSSSSFYRCISTVAYEVFVCFSRYTLMRGTWGVVDFFIVFILQSTKKMDLTLYYWRGNKFIILNIYNW